VNGNAIAARGDGRDVVPSMFVSVRAFRRVRPFHVAVERLRDDARESVKIHKDGTKAYVSRRVEICVEQPRILG